MIDKKSKLEKFNREVLSEASKDAEQITKELDRRRASYMKNALQDISAEAARYRVQEIAKVDAAQGRRVTKVRTDNKYELLQYRESCSDEIFEMVKKKISDFAASDEYPDHVVKLFRKALRNLEDDGELKVFLRPQDMDALIPLLKKEAPDSELSFHEGHFYMGGIRVTSTKQGKRADMAFDSALADLKGQFSDLSGMHVE